MKLKILFALGLMFAPVLSGDRQDAIVSSDRECNPIAQLSRVSAGILRQMGDERFPTSIGARLCENDMLVVPLNSTAQILCSGSYTPIPILSGELSVYEACLVASRDSDRRVNNGETVEDKDGFRRKRPRGEGDKLAIRYPGNTSLRDLQPNIVWSPVEGATEYTVTLQGYLVNWTRTTDRTEISYPQNEQALQYDNSYTLTITARENNSSNNASSKVNFNVLSQDEINAISREEELIHHNLTDEALSIARSLALDSLYQKHHLYGEALFLLEELISEVPQQANLHLRMGELYFKLQHYSSSKKDYQQALNLAIATGNLEVKKEAEIMLNILQDF